MEFLVFLFFIMIWLLMQAGKQSAKKANDNQQQYTDQQRTQSYVSAGREPAYQRSYPQRNEQPKKKQQNNQSKNSTVSAMEKKRAEQRKTTIVDRAKNNNTRFQDDATLRSIEEMHGHAEHHAEAAVAHSRNCQTLGAEGTDLVGESILGSTEDLMVKGYSGNLHFDRDFLGEASDMLTAISYPNFQTPEA